MHVFCAAGGMQRAALVRNVAGEVFPAIAVGREPLVRVEAGRKILRLAALAFEQLQKQSGADLAAV